MSGDDMTAVAVRAWMDKLATTWSSHDPVGVAALFTKDAWYRQGPFGQPHLGRDAILKHWTATLERQRDAEIWFTEPIVANGRAAFEWWCIVRSPATGVARSAAGCVTLWFAADGLCRGLHEYWHSEPHTARPPHDSWPGRRAA